jgi:hypothetical protein
MSAPLSPSSVAGAFNRPLTRRSLLAAALAGTALAATGCTANSGNGADAVTRAQVDRLAAQVQVQESLVAAFERAFTASPQLAAAAATLADQARTQLERLRAAAPGTTTASTTAASTPAASTTAASTAPAVDAAGARAYLRAQVATAANSHAAACPDFTGGRAALLGSIAAGLRGQDGLLA